MPRMRGSGEKFPPDTIMSFQYKPTGLKLGSRAGRVYVYTVYRLRPDTIQTMSQARGSRLPSQISLDAKFSSICSIVGRTIVKVQGYSVIGWSLSDIIHLIQDESPPLIINFGEDIARLEERQFQRSIHIQYFNAMLTKPPAQYSKMDVQRVTLLFFSFNALNLIDDYTSKIIDSQKKDTSCVKDFTIARYKTNNDQTGEEKTNNALNKSDIIRWIYAQQLTNARDGCGGLRGGSFLGIPFNNNDRSVSEQVTIDDWDRVNLAATHNGILALLALGDNLDGINKERLLNTVEQLQDRSTGSFASMQSGECDMRFVYCACTICWLLKDWSRIDTDKTIEYILSSQRYDGAFAMGPHLEGHGGATYVAVASLVLLDALERCNVNALLRWCIMNQGEGFIGRPEKPSDSCYSFWVGAVIALLDRYGMTFKQGNRNYLLMCQSGYGGFSKLPEFPMGDILHGYMGLAGLSLMHTDESDILRTVDPLLTCSISREEIMDQMYPSSSSS